VQGGCNWQTGSWLVGVEADFNWSGINQSVSAAYPLLAATWFPHTETLTHKLSWFATARARFGLVALEHTLFYATGGFAFGRVKSTFSYVAFPAFPFFGEYDATRGGWTAGGGIEHAFGRNWSVKAEYLYVDLGSFTYNTVVVPIFTGEAFAANVKTRMHVARLGINYRFDGTRAAFSRN
jgi:outer membrane immunogenic protein